MNKEIEYLLSPKTIRSKASEILQLAKKDKTNFIVDESKLPAIVDLVIQSIQSNYPTLQVPFHSRWRHFSAGGINRLAILDQALLGLSAREKIIAKMDLVILSVFLDAGAGMQWKFSENNGAFEIGRSEGLAVASFYLFLSGAFSSNSKQPFQADAKALLSFSQDKLVEGFQVRENNPLQGFEGRLQLLRNIGSSMEGKKQFFGDSHQRIGNLFYYIESQAENKHIKAKDILRVVQEAFADIWPARLRKNGFNLGDVWLYPSLGDGLDAYVPFHKLSQWLSYSLMEPLQEAGFIIDDIDELTGLAEYRNGGLLMDGNLLRVKERKLLQEKHAVDSTLVVEWRALTISYLDIIAELVRQKLSLSKEQFPLVKVLEGGTWWAGRKLAAERSEFGEPPIQIISDGTVF